jgi:hypothetical protein
MVLYVVLYLTFILLFSVFWAGSLLEYRIAKHNISMPTVEIFLADLGFPLNRYFSLSSHFNYWRNRGLDPSEYLQKSDMLSDRLTTARFFGGMVILEPVILVRELAFGFSWGTIFWLVVSIGTLLYLRPWRFGMKLLDIEATLESNKSTNS